MADSGKSEERQINESLTMRHPRRTHGGQITNRGVIAKKITTTTPKKMTSESLQQR